MIYITAAQNEQITYLSGVTVDGLVADTSFWTWSGDTPATYETTPGAFNDTAKFGSSVAGTGATITYQFDIASNWTATEKAAFVATAKLWSAVADVTFVEVTAGNAAVSLIRTDTGNASGGQTGGYYGITGTSTLGVATGGRIRIDADDEDFGPLGTSIANYGGYPYHTLVHEWGHVLGLGHAGPYDGSDAEPASLDEFDNIAWTVMSYIDQPDEDFRWGSSLSDDGFRYPNVSVTPMMLDILAIQRMYGVPVDTPLSGGQTYGFHSNIQGEIAKFFDFNINTKPVVTIWNKGANNTLDLSGFAQPSLVDLLDGQFSSAGGLTNNIAIAYGTRIDTAVTGSGDDIILGNDNGNYVMAGSGADAILGGLGNDHLYGAAATAIAGDGADTIIGGGGSDYIQGNAGNDILAGGDGSDRIQGGQGDDLIFGQNGNDSINGNLGNDSIDGGAGNDSLRGGQGNDDMRGSAGDDIMLGDLGADTLNGGAGIDVMTGGGDADTFEFSSGDARFVVGGPTDTITDFTDGIDRLHLTAGIPAQVLRGAAVASFAEAAGLADQLIAGGNAGTFKVGGDTYLFFTNGGSTEAIRLAGFADPTAITVADFV